MMRRHRDLLTIIVASQCIFLTGCLTSLINKNWPPLPSCDAQLAAVRTSSADLAQIKRGDLYAFVSGADLNRYLPSALEKVLPGITNMSVKTDLQQVIVTFDFDETFDTQQVGKIRLVGKAFVNGAVSIQDQTLTITPTIRPGFKFKKVIVSQHSVPVSIVNAVVSGFKDNINGALPKLKIALNLSVFQRIDPTQFLQAKDGFYNVSANPIDLSLKLTQSSVLVDTSGVHAIGKLSDDQISVKQQTAENAPAECKTFPQEYKAFADNFSSFASAQLGSDATSRAVTNAAVSKLYLGAYINHNLATLGISAGYDLAPFPPQHFDQVLQADPAPNLNCQQNAEKTSCDIQEECSQSGDCNPHWDCPSCQWYDVGCDARRVACELDKSRYRAQCEATKETARLACEADKATKKAACEAQKAVDLAGCNLNQTWLNSWSGAQFADVSGNARMTPADVQVQLSSIHAPADLSAISVTGTLAAQANFSADFNLQPYGAGYIACQAPWSGTVSFGVQVPQHPIDVAASIVPAAVQPDKSLQLDFATAEQTFTLKTSVPPALALLSQNPDFVVRCFPATAALGLGVSFSQKLREDLIKDEFEFKVPAQHLPVNVQPFQLDLAGTPLKLTPNWSEKSIGFSEQ